MRLKIWFLETRPQFLMLSVVLAFLGTTIAWYDGHFNLGTALLAGAGLIMAHASVNILNDYFDYRSGVDLKTVRSPFNGGSGLLPARLISAPSALRFGLICFAAAAGVGVYFVFAVGWGLLPLLIVGGACIVLYTPFILKRSWPEWSPGLGLGILPVVGAYFVQTAAYGWTVLAVSVPSGILVHNLLFLNEFPDVEADKIAHRKTMPITMGKGKASLLYCALTVLTYVWIAGLVVARVAPVYALLALLTLPLGIKAISGARQYNEVGRFMPAMASNVLVVLLTQLLMGIGYILAGVR